MSAPTTPDDEIRLDKWLWAARFFKTRRLAVEAIEGGHAQVNGQRAKPGRGIRPGARLEINKDGLSWSLEVLAINRQRRPASEAALLYAEDDASRERRATQVEERRALGAAPGAADGRPGKRDRRLIRRFKEQDASGGADP